MRILILVIFDHIYPGLSILHISTLVSSFSSKFLGEFPRDPPMEGPGRWHGLLRGRRRRGRRRSFSLRLRSDGPRNSGSDCGIGMAIGIPL